MAARGTQEKEELISCLLEKFNGAYELDKNKIVVIPWGAVDLKLTITCAKNTGSKKAALNIEKPNEAELAELRNFLEEIKSE